MPDAIGEIQGVRVPGGRAGITVWGHIKVRSVRGRWPRLALASLPQVEHQAAVVVLGRPGVGEELLARAGFVTIERIPVPLVWEFVDPQSYARALASASPAYEAMQAVGEDAFERYAIELAAAGCGRAPLRAPIAVVGYIGRKRRRRGDSRSRPVVTRDLRASARVVDAPPRLWRTPSPVATTETGA